MYFTPDGRSAIVVAEAMRRLEFRDPHTMELQGYVAAPRMRGHQPRRFLDRRLLCDLHLRIRRRAGQDRHEPPRARRHAAALRRPHAAGHPHRARRLGLLRRRHARRRRGASIDGEKFKETGFIATGVGAHGLYPSRDGKRLYVSNRGTHNLGGVKRRRRQRLGDGFRHAARSSPTGPIPGGGSPDMGNVSADGKYSVAVRRATTASSTPSTPTTARSRRFRSAACRTASPSGRSPDAIRSGIPATCAEATAHRVAARRTCPPPLPPLAIDPGK